MSRAATIGLALRSLLWTFILPGSVTAWLPIAYLGLRSVAFDATRPLHWLGGITLLVGAVILGACILEFARSGKGTLSPVDPPKHLVVQGLYRFVRNPMYVGVVTVLVGETILLGTRAMVTYTASIFAMFTIWTKIYEEPWLARTFPDDWARYKREVPMWIPRLSPYAASRSHSEV